MRNETIAIDERSAHMLATALADTWLARTHRRPTYHYATVRADAVAAMARVPAPEDSFLSLDAEVAAVRDLLAKGYRWIRTDGEWAVFERAVHTPRRPNDQPNEERTEQ